MEIEDVDTQETCIKRSRNTLRLLFMNINGFPSKKANKHKLKKLEEIMNNKDAGIFIESGINEDNQPI